MEVSTENNYNNRKKQNQLGELDLNTSVAQQQANLPVVQSLAQKTDFGNYGDSFANGMINRLSGVNPPTQYEQNWDARQERMMSNPVINSILATKATPQTFKRVDGFSDVANNALSRVVDSSNMRRQDAYNMAQLNALASMYNANANIYNTEMSLDGKGAQNAHLLFKEQQDQLKLRNSMADNILAGINGYADIDDENVKGQVRSEYIQTGRVPTSISKDGKPIYADQFDTLRKAGLEPKTISLNEKNYIEVDGVFYEQR